MRLPAWEFLDGKMDLLDGKRWIVTSDPFWSYSTLNMTISPRPTAENISLQPPSPPTIDNSTTVPDDSLQTAYTFTCAIFMLALCVIGACGNVLSIMIFTRRSMRSSINVLLTGLSIVDLSVLI